MTIEQAIEYATSGQSSGGPITQDALSVLAVAARDRQRLVDDEVARIRKLAPDDRERLLDACERFLKLDEAYGYAVKDHVIGRADASLVRSKGRDREQAFNNLVATVKSMGGFAE